jgi:hypothetical protein
MKEKFLVAVDYGQGGVWGYIYAESRAEIEDKFPELAIVDEEPEWLETDSRSEG